MIMIKISIKFLLWKIFAVIRERNEKHIYDANLEPKFQNRVVANLIREYWREKIKLRLNKINK